MTNGLLDGLRVLDLSLWQPGHTPTQLLADLGAQVVKVEPPGGDRMRPLVDRFVNFDGHKQSVTIDLKSDHGKTALLGLAADAEVVVENYRPGVADRLGVGFDQQRAANPSIVLCSISGFGQQGPLASETGHDANYQAYAGAMATPDRGGAPVPAGLLEGDQGSGLAAAFAILAAVLCARRTGEGEHIDVSVADLLASWVAPMGPVDPRREPTTQSKAGHSGTPAMGLFETADEQWVVLGVLSEDHFWDALCDGLGLDNLIGLRMAERSPHTTRLREAIIGAIAARPRDELLQVLAPRSVPIAPVLTRDEMLNHPHFRSRGTITTGSHGYLRVGHPIRYRIHPSLPPGPPPPLADRDPS